MGTTSGRSLGIHPYYLIAGKDVQIAVLISSPCFRTHGWISSGSKALVRFKPLRSCVTPSFGATILHMNGADLSRSGT